MKRLTDKELESLSKALTNIEDEFNEDVVASMFNYDDNIIDIEIEFEDGNTETTQLDRETFKEV